jgi:hypothetical protein
VFLENSRYNGVEQIEVRTRDGRSVKAVKLRRLPATIGDAHSVAGTDRLDIIAQRQYSDGTQFWHIADANTELHANDLVRETNRVIRVPRS